MNKTNHTATEEVQDFTAGKSVIRVYTWIVEHRILSPWPTTCPIWANALGSVTKQNTVHAGWPSIIVLWKRA